MSLVQSFTNALVQSVVTSGARASQHNNRSVYSFDVDICYWVLGIEYWVVGIGSMTEATGLNIWSISSLRWYELLVE
jgi:hypothetical protein